MNEKKQYHDSVQQMLMALHPFAHMLNSPSTQSDRLDALEDTSRMMADTLAVLIDQAPAKKKADPTLQQFMQWRDQQTDRETGISQAQMQAWKTALAEIVALRTEDPEKFFILLGYFMEKLQSGIETIPHGAGE